MEDLLTQLLGKALFPRGNSCTSGAIQSSLLVLDSLSSDRHLCSGKGKSNNLWIMSYEKMLAC